MANLRGPVPAIRRPRPLLFHIAKCHTTMSTHFQLRRSAWRPGRGLYARQCAGFWAELNAKRMNSPRHSEIWKNETALRDTGATGNGRHCGGLMSRRFAA
jgi:hypothetical protein